MRSFELLSLFLFALFGSVTAQFGFFDQMFGGGGQQQQQQPQNVPSDSSWYRSNVEKAYCDKYLCPDTLGKSSPPAASVCLALVREHPELSSRRSMRSLSTPLPLFLARQRGQVRTSRGTEDMRLSRRFQGRRGGEESRARQEGAALMHTGSSSRPSEPSPSGTRGGGCVVHDGQFCSGCGPGLS